MLSQCHSEMTSTQFEKLPNSKNAVEFRNRFGKQTHREPLKQAMMNTYKEDMAKTMEILARGLCTSYENVTQSSHLQRSNLQNKARSKRYSRENDDPDGPPDAKKNFKSNTSKHIKCNCNTAYTKHLIGKTKPLSLQNNGLNSCYQSGSSGTYHISCYKISIKLLLLFQLWKYMH